jgi:hypothetical protein
MSPDDYDFIRKERRLVSSWPLVGGGALFALLVIYAWIAIDQPQLANPIYVYNGLLNDTLTSDIVYVLAMLAPVLMMMLFATVGIMLGYTFAFMRKEKRLLDIIDRRLND